MGALEFIATLAGSLAWPLAVVVCVIVLRRQVAGLLRRLESVEIGGQKATFGDLDKVESNVAEVLNSTRPNDPTGGEDRDPTDAVWGPILLRAPASPRRAVLEAWNRLEHELNTLADAVEPTAPHGWPQVVAHLQILDDWAGLRPAVRELRHLRDTAASDSAAPSPADAIRYVSVARDLSRSLDAVGAAIADRPRQGARDDGVEGPSAIGSGR